MTNKFLKRHWSVNCINHGCHFKFLDSALLQLLEYVEGLEKPMVMHG